MNMTKLDFGHFRPKVLKTRIAPIARRSHMPGFLKYGHILQIMYGLTTRLNFVLEAVVQDNLCSKDYS